ncbi:Fur family transcriptional regulator [Natronospora cellulosivora (SeqCode)]
MKRELDDFIIVLKEKGIRLTKQREAIIDVLLEAERPITALHIFQKLEEKFPKLQLSTVYRNLNHFEDCDILRKMDLDINNKESYFELVRGEHHHHLICVDCDDIVPLDCPLQDYQKKVCSETNYTIIDHNIKLFGICPDCKKNENKI